MFEELGYKLKKVVGGYQYYFHDNINDEIVKLLIFIMEK